MGKKSATARQREAQKARQRRTLRLMVLAAVAMVAVTTIALIVYFTMHKDSGLVIEDLVVGTGEEAQVNDVVTVHYTVWLDDGTQVLSSVGGKPSTFILGTGRVIEGWDQGIVGMKVGGTRRLIIPPDLGYGDEAFEDVPANSTLTCEVQLMSVE